MHISLGFVRNAVAPSSEGTHQGFLGAWIPFRREGGKLEFVRDTDREVLDVWALVEFVGYASVNKGLRASTVENYLAAMKYSPRTIKGFNHPSIKKCLA